MAVEQAHWVATCILIECKISPADACGTRQRGGDRQSGEEETGCSFHTSAGLRAFLSVSRHGTTGAGMNQPGLPLTLVMKAAVPAVKRLRVPQSVTMSVEPTSFQISREPTLNNW